MKVAILNSDDEWEWLPVSRDGVQDIEQVINSASSFTLHVPIEDMSALAEWNENTWSLDGAWIKGKPRIIVVANDIDLVDLDTMDALNTEDIIAHAHVTSWQITKNSLIVYCEETHAIMEKMRLGVDDNIAEDDFGLLFAVDDDDATILLDTAAADDVHASRGIRFIPSDVDIVVKPVSGFMQRIASGVTTDMSKMIFRDVFNDNAEMFGIAWTDAASKWPLGYCQTNIGFRIPSPIPESLTFNLKVIVYIAGTEGMSGKIYTSKGPGQGRTYLADYGNIQNAVMELEIIMTRAQLTPRVHTDRMMYICIQSPNSVLTGGLYRVRSHVTYATMTVPASTLAPHEYQIDSHAGNVYTMNKEIVDATPAVMSCIFDPDITHSASYNVVSTSIPNHFDALANLYRDEAFPRPTRLTYYQAADIKPAVPGNPGQSHRTNTMGTDITALENVGDTLTGWIEMIKVVDWPRVDPFPGYVQFYYNMIDSTAAVHEFLNVKIEISADTGVWGMITFKILGTTLFEESQNACAWEFDFDVTRTAQGLYWVVRGLGGGTMTGTYAFTDVIKKFRMHVDGYVAANQVDNGIPLGQRFSVEAYTGSLVKQDKMDLLYHDKEWLEDQIPHPRIDSISVDSTDYASTYRLLDYKAVNDEMADACSRNAYFYRLKRETTNGEPTIDVREIAAAADEDIYIDDIIENTLEINFEPDGAPSAVIVKNGEESACWNGVDETFPVDQTNPIIMISRPEIPNIYLLDIAKKIYSAATFTPDARFSLARRDLNVGDVLRLRLAGINLLDDFKHLSTGFAIGETIRNARGWSAYTQADDVSFIMTKNGGRMLDENSGAADAGITPVYTFLTSHTFVAGSWFEHEVTSDFICSNRPIMSLVRGGSSIVTWYFYDGSVRVYTGNTVVKLADITMGVPFTVRITWASNTTATWLVRQAGRADQSAVYGNRGAVGAEATWNGGAITTVQYATGNATTCDLTIHAIRTSWSNAIDFPRGDKIRSVNARTGKATWDAWTERSAIHFYRFPTGAMIVDNSAANSITPMIAFDAHTIQVGEWAEYEITHHRGAGGLIALRHTDNVGSVYMQTDHVEVFDGNNRAIISTITLGVPFTIRVICIDDTTARYLFSQAGRADVDATYTIPLARTWTSDPLVNIRITTGSAADTNQTEYHSIKLSWLYDHEMTGVVKKLRWNENDEVMVEIGQPGNERSVEQMINDIVRRTRDEI
jgi:hypothetical protein